MRKNKTTSFDLTDEYESRLLAHAEKSANGRYSRYIKRLIANDMEASQASSTIPNHAALPVLKEPDEEAMNGFL